MGVEAQRPYLTVGGVTVPAFNVLLPLSVTVGRSEPSSQPDANALSFGYIGETFPTYIYRGSPVTVWMGAKAEPDLWDDIWNDIWTGEAASESGGNKRFIGRVADVTAEADMPNGMVRAQVTCIGMLTDLANLIIGDEPWPTETDWERVERIRLLLRTDFQFSNDGSADLRLRRRDVDKRNALELLHEFAASVGSIVWEYPDGTVHYQRWDTRTVPVWQQAPYLPPLTIIADAQWAQSTEQLIDRVRVEYGDDPPEGDRPDYVAGDGVHETRLSGELADIGSAEAVGNLVLERWGRTDLWDAPQVNTGTDLLDSTTYEAILALLPGDPLTTGALGPTPTPGLSDRGVWFLEGWTETWDRAGAGAPLTHDFTLAVSDVRRFAVDAVDTVLKTTVDPSSWAMSNTPLANVNVAFMSAPWPPDGMVHLIVDGMEPMPPVPVSSQSAAMFTPFPANVLAPGPHEFVGVYSGAPGQLPAVSPPVIATVTTTAAAGFLITLTSPNARPHVGDTHLLYATVFPPSGNPDDDVPEGTIRFEYGASSTGPWTLHRIVDASGGDDGRVVTCPIDVLPGVIYWRARFIPAPDDTRWTAKTSNVIVLTPIQMVYSTMTYNPTWAGTWDSHWIITPDTDLRQGDWGDMGPGGQLPRGDYRALVGFNVQPVDWRNFTITKVEVYLTNLSFQNGQGGTVRVGSHAETTKPPDVAQGTGITPPTILHRSDVNQWPQGSSKWVDISGWGRSFVTGEVKGIVVGPADNPGSIVTQALMSYTADPPKIRVTGYQWSTS